MIDASKLRYLAGGALAAGLNNVILIGGNHWGVGYVTLSTLCFAVTGTLAYGFHSIVTFRRRLNWGSYLLYMSGLLVGLGLTLIILYLLYDVMGLPMWIAAPVLTVLMLAYHFTSARIATTRRLRG